MSDSAELVMLNDLDRYRLVIDVIDRVPGLADRAAPLRERISAEREQCRRHTP